MSPQATRFPFGPDGLNVHGSAILLGPGAVLVRGPARAGKSSLCLLALQRGREAGLEAGLVSDDRVLIAPGDGEALRLGAPEAIEGLIEVSGAGLLRLPVVRDAPLRLLVDLLPAGEIERLPQEPFETLLGRRVRRIALARREAAFGAGLLVALAANGYALSP
ncbi:hypothetical protein [Aurantimonas sp. Leaf443]|uniref:HPr kinase/phosphorylase n=1 Tax=Aurantimonas sp. Leaf443 TaxID=1736378 RepID=UPI0006FB225F|nr:hypothetical protein [Aurantimonas sp. Leaf443]KQT83970.1 hypothetical protein ASG48_11345 [Aurantimonas sp. Leaf443]